MAPRVKVTTNQIAQEVGVSQATVANILNQAPGLKYSEGTRQKVFAASQRLGYQVSAMRRAVKAPLKNIGLVIASSDLFGETFMGAMLRGVYAKCAEGGYSIITFDNPGNIAHQDDCQRMADKILELGRSGLLDGILIDKGHIAEAQLEEIKRLKVPFVYINGRGFVRQGLDCKVGQNGYTREYDEAHRNLSGKADFSGTCMVSINHYDGGRLAARQLLQLGHRRMGVLSLRGYGDIFAPYRHVAMLVGFHDEMAATGMAWEPALASVVNLEDTAKIAAELDRMLSLPEPPTALFCCDDAIALFALGHLGRKGISVPRDFSICGYGGLPGIYTDAARLSTLRAPWARMGELGVEMLLALAGGSQPAEPFVSLDPVLVHGETIGRSAPPIR